jgi:hypothetical protein
VYINHDRNAFEFGWLSAAAKIVSSLWQELPLCRGMGVKSRVFDGGMVNASSES